MKEILSADPSLSISGEAANGADAVRKVLESKPDIVIMDIDMPIMNGLEATGQIMSASPVPVLVFTHNTDPSLPFKALERGAADFLLKPAFEDLNRPDYVDTFIAKLKALSFRGRRLPAQSLGLARGSLDGAALRKPKVEHKLPARLPAASIVAIGASTGGPQAVLRVLSALPAPFPLPIAVVQHIETGFDRGYAEWLASESGHEVVLAAGGEEPRAGRVYVAPTDFHLKLADGRFVLDAGPRVQNQKPAVDVLFESLAQAYKEKTLAVLLTGMGRDGAAGCAAVQAAKGFTLVQDESTSLIFGMPKAAIEQGSASLVLPIGDIGGFLARVAGLEARA